MHVFVSLWHLLLLVPEVLTCGLHFLPWSKTFDMTLSTVETDVSELMDGGPYLILL